MNWAGLRFDLVCEHGGAGALSRIAEADRADGAVFEDHTFSTSHEDPATFGLWSLSFSNPHADGRFRMADGRNVAAADLWSGGWGHPSFTVLDLIERGIQSVKLNCSDCQANIKLALVRLARALDVCANTERQGAHVSALPIAFLNTVVQQLGIRHPRSSPYWADVEEAYSEAGRRWEDYWRLDAQRSDEVDLRLREADRRGSQEPWDPPF